MGKWVGSFNHACAHPVFCDEFVCSERQTRDWCQPSHFNCEI